MKILTKQMLKLAKLMYAHLFYYWEEPAIKENDGDERTSDSRDEYIDNVIKPQITYFRNI